VLQGLGGAPGNLMVTGRQTRVYHGRRGARRLRTFELAIFPRRFREALHFIMVLNVIETSQTRYILDADDLESFLKRKFGQHYPNYDFKVEVEHRHSILCQLQYN
jgi:hypothetical protein